MKKLLLLVTVFFQLRAEIHQIESLQHVAPVLDSLDQHALVVFDVDETLIMAQDHIRSCYPTEIKDLFRKEHFNEVVTDKQQWEYLDSIKLKMSAQKLIEPTSVQVIKELQKRGIAVIALTHMHAGPYHTIDSLEKWRFEQLVDLGIDVSKHNEPHIIFDNLPKLRDQHPVFYKGVLATARSCSKGEALAAFLKRTGKMPSQVVFFDDLAEHVKTVEDHMKELGIPYEGYHYICTKKNATMPDIELAKFQYQYLIKHAVWLSDSQAAAMMKE